MIRILEPEGAHLASHRRLARFDRATVLEVGCGDGRLTVGLAEQAASVFAFDPDPESVAAAKEKMPLETAERVTFASARLGRSRSREPSSTSSSSRGPSDVWSRRTSCTS